MDLRLLTRREELTAIATEWDRLAAGVPMRGYAWLAGWWEVYGDQQGELFVLAVYQDTRLVGLAPWRMERSLSQGRVIRWLGDGEVCTDHLTVLTEQGERQQVVETLADWLVQSRDQWELLKLDHSDAEDETVSSLLAALQERDCHVESVQDDACWAIELPREWEEFLARQSKSHRKQLRRAEKRGLESDACSWHAVRTPDDWQRAWPILVDLHQRRRQSLGEPGCFASERFTRFHHVLSQQLLEADQLRMSWLELEGCPVAAEYHFASPHAVYAYQGGVDPERLEDEPGRLSNIATLKDAIAESRTTFDFLRGDEPYKAHWRAVARPTLCRIAVAPKNSARLRAQAVRAAGSAKGLLRSGLRTLQRDR